MAINKKLIHFKSKTNFLNEYNNNNILPTSIVFILDAKQIWTHGQYYSCPYSVEELETIFGEKLNKLESTIITNGDGTSYLTNDGSYKSLDAYQKISQADAKYATITAVNNIDNRLEIIEDNAVTKEELNNGLSEKIDIIEGKLLSTEDFTSALKAKLESLNNYDDTEINEKVDGIQSLINTLVNKDASAAINTFNEIITFLEGVENTENLDNIIASIEQLIAAINTALNNYLTKTDASSTYLAKNAKAVSATSADSATKATLDASGNIITSTYATKTELNEKASTSNATQAANGLMSASDKTKLDGIASGATAVTTNTVSSWGYTKNTGTVTGINLGNTSYSPNSGVVSLPAYPTTLPASDVYSWAKASTKPTYTYSEVGAAASSHTQAYTTLTGSGTTANQAIVSSGTANGWTLKTLGSNAFTSTTIPTNTNQLTNGAGFITGITKSMVTTALGYTPPTSDTWRSISDSINSTSSDVSASSKAVKTAYDLAASKTSNTGTVTSVATGVGLTGGSITTSGTVKAKLRSETALTVDSAAATTTSGRVYPVAVDKSGYLSVNVPWSDTNTNTWRPLGTTADTACAGNDSRLSNARPASDVYSWAKASSKPSYSWSEITSKPTSMPASDVYSWAKASSKPSYSWSEIGSKPTFATVATSGKYSDLSDKPTIPTNNNQLTNGSGFITGITKSMVTTALGYTPPTTNTTYGVATTSANGLMSSTDKVKIDRSDSYTTASTVASLNVDYKTIYVTLNANASLSASAVGATYNGRSITAYVYTSAARTITIPTSGNYVSMCGSSYTTTAGKWVEFNLVCVNGIWHIAKLEQE